MIYGRMSDTSYSGYTEGVHAWVDTERTEADLEVRGHIPHDLRGLFARNSANPAHEPPGRYHWFDGDGMVHGVSLEDGRASYRNRYTRTAAFEREQREGHALWGGILNPVAPKDGPPIKDTANTHLVPFGGGLLATWWLSGRPLVLSRELQTLGAPPFVEALSGLTVAAHPKVDPKTGELAFFGFQMHKRPWYWVGIADAQGRLTRVQEIETAGPRIPHDIGLTDRFVVILDMPLGWSREALRQGKRIIGFEREAPCRMGLWPRSGGEVRWFDIPPCYVYHLTSSYEEGSSVVLTGCRIDDPIPEARDDRETSPHLDIISLSPVTSRWRLDLSTGSASVETLDDVPTEFPRVNDATWGRRARFAYHPRIARTRALQFDGFLKLDYEKNTQIARDYPGDWRGGEVVFAPKPGGAEEDDGYVLTLLAHRSEPRSELQIFDAKAVDQPPVAVVEIPHRVPLGFHAEWLPTPG